ncbi:SDR family oxidoreductase [Acinetobacter sp. WU_MDCI_Abxc22]|uniref:SDR family oxidoreductase n=1 Tax=Acinetobacter sp. WU_MDCI_Abxc22 TaxID=2850071 RepID=UPI0021CD71A8|nr:SDR family oxidoreductase [Acinetobacter sp. WU_MDCI_Abxc22]MCU4361311.1 SDR family oxidoreductase [Acinetobacter sp. WU_MDCI_Abxc22]
MKKVIVIGANGLTAQQVISRLIKQPNVQLSLFVRQASKLHTVHDDKQINIFEGDAINMDDLRAAIQGQDIVISTLGGMDLDVKTKNIVKVMRELGVRRLIAISAGGIYDELPEPFNSWDKQMVGYTRPTNLRTAEVIEHSPLEYTILRPVWLTDKSSEEFQLTKKGEVFKGTETSRASLGRFIADLVENPQIHIRENLGISQPNTEGDRPAAYC